MSGRVGIHPVGKVAAAALLLVLSGPRPAGAQVGTVAPGLGGASASAFELTFWQSVAASDDQAQLEAYLAAYPQGAFSKLARLKIAALRQRQPLPAEPAAVVRVPAPLPPAPPAEIPPPTPVAAPTPPLPATPTAAPLAAAPPVSAALAPSAAVAPAVPSLAEQLQQLANGQASQHPALARLAGATAVPVAPTLPALAELRLPDHFCSALARNLFYDAQYKPVMEQADRNNQSAIAYLQDLQRLYDERGRAGDIAGQNLLAAASRDYSATAAEAFKARSAYDAVFARILAVPIRACPAGEG